MANIGQPLLILGMHRSGTSFLASLLQSMGVHIGDQLVGPKKGNPRGHFEAVPILEFHESLLSRSIKDKLTIFDKGIFVPEPFSCAYSEEDKQAARQLIESLQRDGVWGWKEPRTCLFLDLWSEILPDVRAVIVYRHPLEVHQSLLRRGHWGLALFHGLAMDTYATFNRALLAWNTPDKFLFNASAGFENIDYLSAKLKETFNLPSVPQKSCFYKNEFKSLEISPSLHKLTSLLFPEAVAAFDLLQERADIPYEWVHRSDDPVFESLHNTLAPYLKNVEPPARAQFLPVLDGILKAAETAEGHIYTNLAQAICLEHLNLGHQYKSLGDQFVQQQCFLREQTKITEKAWKDYESLNKRHEEELKKLWEDFESLGKLYAQQQSFLNGQSKKYDKIWEDHLRLKKAHDLISDQFRSQQERFANQTVVLNDLKTKHFNLGKAFKEQQEFLRRQTSEFSKVWADYEELQKKHQQLGQEFKTQQLNMASLWDNCQNMWTELELLREVVSLNTSNEGDSDRRDNTKSFHAQ